MKVLFEDADIICVEKPAGLATLKGARPSLEEQFLSVSTKGAPHLFLNRLDHETSGVVAVVRSQDVFEYFRSEWSVAAEKIYCARVSAREDACDFETLAGKHIEFPIGHSAKSAKKMLVKSAGHRVVKGDRWLPAHTEILSAVHTGGVVSVSGAGGFMGEKLKASSGGVTSGTGELELRLHTGVRHQIRVHLAALGWPIVGDELYRGVSADRMYLHAWKLKLKKRSGEVVEVVSELPWQKVRGTFCE